MKRDILDRLQADRDAHRSVVLATVLATGEQRLIHLGGNDPLQAEAEQAIRSDKPATVETPDGDVFLNVFNPRLRMLIVGAVHIAQFLAPMAQMTGYEVSIIDPRQAWATPERFPGITIIDEWPDDAMDELHPDHRTAVVTLTHDPKLDDPALNAALGSDAFYIGSLGSTRTHAKRVDRLKAAGFDDGKIGRIHAPVGLNIGAKSPAEIAVSVMGQVTAALRGAA
ncbi:MAG: XdhC family protein [Minwuia sp.]|uniref:XdhC family protein n=1 Tax=Minwuia sp. TaxID=2493630 RepID=UPI003A8C41B0